MTGSLSSALRRTQFGMRLRVWSRISWGVSVQSAVARELCADLEAIGLHVPPSILHSNGWRDVFTRAHRKLPAGAASIVKDGIDAGVFRAVEESSASAFRQSYKERLILTPNRAVSVLACDSSCSPLSVDHSRIELAVDHPFPEPCRRGTDLEI